MTEDEMYLRAEVCRRRGMEAKRRVALATEHDIKETFEHIAHDWFTLAEQIEWLEEHHRAQRAAASSKR